MATSFLFVDASKHDRMSRSRARSHVLKGKNLGRKLKRRSPLARRPAAVLQSASRVIHEDSPLQVRNVTQDLLISASMPLSYSPFNVHLVGGTYPFDDTLQCEHLVKKCEARLFGK